jgi:hypothetical protein
VHARGRERPRALAADASRPHGTLLDGRLGLVNHRLQLRGLAAAVRVAKDPAGPGPAEQVGVGLPKRIAWDLRRWVEIVSLR